jgi:SagB-type dehydrogenase family enzyme
MSESNLDVGRRYLTETRYTRANLGEPRTTFPRAETYKDYAAATQTVKLDPKAVQAPADLWECLSLRRSHRRYKDRPLTLGELTALVWSTQGITLAGRHYLFRTSPSAGALYPVETYLSVQRVDGVDTGIWHLNVQKFELELLAAGDYRRSLVEAGLTQNFLGTASVVFLWTGILNRAMWKYRERAIRYLFLDAGHICQNLMLAATALGLGCCPVGAFFDDEVERLVGVDGHEEVALYLASVGPL